MISKQMWHLFILLWMVAHTLGQNGAPAQKSQTDDHLEIATLFSDMKPKSTPLYLCDSGLGGIEYEPPSALDCNTNPQDNDTTKVVSVTLFWDDISTYYIDGFECTGIEEQAIPVSYLWFVKDIHIGVTRLQISKEQCHKMVKEKVSPNGDKMHEQAPGTWETNRKETYVSSWFSLGMTYKKTVVNYRIQQLKVGIREADGIIRTTAQVVSPCHYNDSHCKTQIGMLVWLGNEVKTCRLLEGDKSNCLLRNGSDGMFLTCPDLTLSLHNVDEINMCNEVFGFSNGIYFLQNQKGQISETMSVPEQVLRKITKPRSKREVENHKKVNPFEAEIKANLNYLYHTVRKGTSEAIWKLENKICEVNKRQIEMMSLLSQSGHPSLTTRFMYHNPSLRAEYVGDLLMVYQCLEIREYMFLPRDTCTFQWPVRFLQGQQVYTGYVEPITHTIVDVPTIQQDRSNEDCRRFFYQSENYVVLLAKNKAIKVSTEKLPMPGSSHSKALFPALTFLTHSTLHTSSDESLESMYIWLRELQQRNAPRTQKRTEHYLSVQSKSFLESMTSLFSNILPGIGSAIGSVFSFFFGGIWTFLGWIGYIIVAFVIVFILVQTGLFCTCLKMPLRIFSLIIPKRLFKSSIGKKIRKLYKPKKVKPDYMYYPSAPMY